MPRPPLSALLRGAAAALLLAAPPAAALWLTPGDPDPDLTFLSGPEPETLDPARATGVLDIRLLSALFEGLVRLDEATLQPAPAACERFAASPDQRRFRFELREGLRWSDGSPLTADDFVGSWRRAADPATRAPLRREAALVAAGARVEGPRTIVVELDRPAPELLSLLTLPVFLPVPLDRVEAHPERWTRPEHIVSNGPFRLAEWRVGHRLLLERNPHYRREVGMQRIEALTTSGAAVTDDTAYLLYATGACDLVFSVPSGVGEALEGRPDLYAGPALSTVFLRFNVTREPLDDPRVRRALAMTIERQPLVQRVLRGGERPTTALVPPGLGGHQPAEGLGFDPQAARREVEAWRADGGVQARPLELMYASSDELSGHAAEVLQAAWRRHLGLDVTLRPTERKTYFARMRRLDYDLCWSNWVADYPDPENFLSIFRAGSGNNRTGFDDPRYDALLDAAQAAPDAAARLALLRRAEARLLQAAPLAPLYNPQRAILCRPWVEGLEPNPLNLIDWAALTVDRRARAEGGPR